MYKENSGGIHKHRDTYKKLLFPWKSGFLQICYQKTLGQSIPIKELNVGGLYAFQVSSHELIPNNTTLYSLNSWLWLLTVNSEQIPCRRNCIQLSIPPCGKKITFFSNSEKKYTHTKADKKLINSRNNVQQILPAFCKHTKSSARQYCFLVHVLNIKNTISL